ncbi:MAG TPA: IS1380 family transposase [Nakamurella sp.]
MLAQLASPKGASRRRGFRRVGIGASDHKLTGHAGVAAVAEVDRVLGIAQAMDCAVGPVKQRRRGVTAGGLLLSMASAQMTGADFLVGMDLRRTDVAGQQLEPVPTPASTTTAQLAKRFTATHLAGIENAIGMVNARVLALVPERRRIELLAAATIDGDTTDVEVYGRDKQDAVYNYQGQRAYRPHIAFWAEGGVSLAADLMKADEDPRPVAAQLLDRAIAQLPPGVAKIRCRWDAGYFAADLAKHCIDRGIEFAIGVKRNSAVVRACREAPSDGWHPATDMPHTEVAVIDYLPGTWPEDSGVVCIARRTRIPVELMPTDPRARKLRTIDKAQQALALEGKLDYVYGYSFILTNLDVSTPAKLVEVEHWYRHRTDIEALNKDAKHGAALRHLPSGDRTVNTVWMWAALLACAISNWIQEITGIDDGRGRARRTLARMRRELFNIPARVTHTNRALTLRPPPDAGLLPVVLPRLQDLPTIRAA